jgi:hypothetical protein
MTPVSARIGEIAGRVKAKADNPQDYNAHVAFMLAAWDDVQHLLSLVAQCREAGEQAEARLETTIVDGLSWCRLAHDWMRAHDQLLGWVQSNPTAMRLFLTDQPKIDLPTVRDEGSPADLRRAAAILAQPGRGSR